MVRALLSCGWWPVRRDLRLLNLLRVASLSVLMVFMLSGATCHPTGSSNSPLYDVRISLLTDLSPSVTAPNSEAVGKKTVNLGLQIHRPMTINSWVVSYWPAGHRDQAQSVETDVDLELTSSASAALQCVIPGSENLGLCDAMYFTVAFAYTAENDPSGLYISQAKLIQPRRAVDNLTVRVPCGEPPPADQ